MKEQILNLRKQGKSYREIEQILGCSRSTISYHCGEGQKQKKLDKQRLTREQNSLLKKIDNFKNRKVGGGRKQDNEIKSNHKKQLSDKARDFQLKAKNFSSQDVLDKFGKNPKCYLTGKVIDWSQPRTYSFDHVVPLSRGGTCTLDNLGITTRSANNAKDDLLLDEFLTLCESILKNFGYDIKPPVLE